MRDQTEWVELIDNEVNILVGADKKYIIGGVNTMINKESNFDINLYGNGTACKNIVNELISSL